MEKELKKDFDNKHHSEALKSLELDLDQEGNVVDPANDISDDPVRIYLKRGVDPATLPVGEHSNMRPGDKEMTGLQVGPENDGRLKEEPHPEQLYFKNFVRDLEESTGVQHTSEENQKAYDYVGLFKDPDRERLSSISPEDGQPHLSDKYKFPSHPTFSTESIYYKSQEETPAGTWGDQGEFIPAPEQLASGMKMDDLPPEMRPTRVLEGTSLEQATNTGPFLQKEEEPVKDPFDNAFFDFASAVTGGVDKTRDYLKNIIIPETTKTAANRAMEFVDTGGQWIRDLEIGTKPDGSGLDVQELMGIFGVEGELPAAVTPDFNETQDLSGSPLTQMVVDIGSMIMVALITKALRGGTVTSISTGDVLGGPEENLADVIPESFRSTLIDSLRSDEDAPAFINRVKKLAPDVLLPEALVVSLGVAYKGLKKTGKALAKANKELGETGAINLFGDGRAVFAPSRKETGEVVWRKEGEEPTPGFIKVLQSDGTLKEVPVRDYMPDPDAPNFGFPEPPKIPDNHPVFANIPKMEGGQPSTHLIDTPERVQMRAEFVAAAIENFGRAPKGRKPILYLKGGGGGSGKGAVDKRLKKSGVMPSNIGEVNPDDIKLAITEFQQIVDAGDSRAATIVHEESSMIAKDIEAAALEQQVDFIIDKVLGDPVKAKKIIEKFKSNGFEVRLIGVTIPVEEAAIRAGTRAYNSGRFVPMSALADGHKQFAKVYKELAKMVDESILYDNMPPVPIVLAQAGKMGVDFKIKHKAAWADFQTKEKINVEAKTLNELREESLKDTGTGPSSSVTGPDNRGVKGGEPGDGGLVTEGQGQDGGILSGKRGSVKNQFVRFADEGQEIPPEVRQYVNTEGRVFDIAGRLSINWDRINTAADVKRTMAGARSLAADEIAEAAGEVRKLEDVAAEAQFALKEDLPGELKRLHKIQAEQGITDVDLTEMRILETASAIELNNLKTLVMDGFPGAGEKLKSHYARHVMIMSQRQAFSATSSRIFGAGRIGVTGEEVGERAFAEQVENLSTVLPSDVNADTLAIRLDALETPEQLEEMARIAATPGFGKMFLEAWIAGLLTSPKTHIVNAMSNTLMQLNHNFIDRPVAAAIGALRGSGDRARFGEAKEAMFGFSEALRESWRMSKKAFISGEPQSELTKLEVAREPAFTTKNIDANLKRIQKSGGLRAKVLPSGLDESGPVGRAVDMFANWGIRMSFRALQSSDEFFKTFAYRMEVNQLAYRQAVNEGLDGHALADRIYELKRNPSPEIKHGAETAAQYLTFTNALGDIGQKGTAFVDSIPFGRLVIPFIRTPTNITKYTLERVPGLNFILANVREDMAAGGARADMSIGRMMLGGMMMVTFGQMAAEGMITGSSPAGPENAGMRAARRRLNMQPNSLRLTDDEGGHHYYSFSRMDPLGQLLGISADFKLIMQEADQNTAAEVALAVTAALSDQIVNKTWAQGVDNFVKAVRDRGHHGKRFIDNLVRTVIPRAAATFGKPSGTSIKELETYLQIVKAELGVCETCENKKNFWGEEITRDGAWGPDFFSPIRSVTEKRDFVDQEIVAQNMSSGIGRHPRLISGIKMTAAEYNQFKDIFASVENVRGKTIKVKLEQLIRSDRYKGQTDGPDGGKAQLILRAIQNWQLKARGILLKTNLDLADRVDQKAQEKNEALRGKGNKGATPNYGAGLVVR